jgi:hypothetical protein
MYVKLQPIHRISWPYEIGSPVYVQCSICDESCTTKFTANHLRCRLEYCSGIVCAWVWQNQLLVHAWCSEITDMTDLLCTFVYWMVCNPNSVHLSWFVSCCSWSATQKTILTLEDKSFPDIDNIASNKYWWLKLLLKGATGKQPIHQTSSFWENLKS